MRRASLVICLISASCLASLASTAVPSFASAHSIEAFRVAPPYDMQKTTRRTFHDQKVIAGPRQLPPASARSVAEELQRVYRVDWSPRYCAFVPRYGLRLNSLEGVVEVLVCPHCGEVQFYAPAHIRSASVSAELLRLLQSAFPEHPLRPNKT